MKTHEDDLKNATQNKSIIEGLYKGFAKGDIQTVLGAMDSTIVWNEAEGNAYSDSNL